MPRCPSIKMAGMCAFCGLEVAELGTPGTIAMHHLVGAKMPNLMNEARTKIPDITSTWEAPNSEWLHNETCIELVGKRIAEFEHKNRWK